MGNQGGNGKTRRVTEFRGRVQIHGTPPTVGLTPAVVLDRPKYGHNVSGALRAAACFGAMQLWWTGDRIWDDIGKMGHGRLPREERMRAYGDVQMFQNDRPLDAFQNVTPVVVEVECHGENLVEFIHPMNAVYIFGPEDGNVCNGLRAAAHRFVTIPTNHCMNLAAAVYVVLYDRILKDEWKWEGKG